MLIPLFAVFAALGSATSATRPPAPLPAAVQPSVPAVVGTDWLAAHITDPNIVVLTVVHAEEEYRRGHIAGSRSARYEDFVVEESGPLSLSAEVPSLEVVEAALERLGVTDRSHVVVTGSAMMAARVFYTLEYVGLPRVSMLDGGLTKWRAEGRAVGTEAPTTVARGGVTLRVRHDVHIEADELRSLLGRKGIALFDTRSQGEYDGTADRRGSPSFGHLPGARRLEWQETMANPREFHLKDRATLERMWAERMAPGDTVIAYCWVGMRASVTYAISRALGYPVRMYDGSDEEWQKRGLPMTKDPVALRSVP
ncbi:MAG: sulfurtransferase [Gemmatimonadaceae bacterium]|nr:sulfurtransferase [Gemmatimonadaceae bacterium]